MRQKFCHYWWQCDFVQCRDHAMARYPWWGQKYEYDCVFKNEDVIKLANAPHCTNSEGMFSPCICVKNFVINLFVDQDLTSYLLENSAFRNYF